MSRALGRLGRRRAAQYEPCAGPAGQSGAAQYVRWASLFGHREGLLGTPAMVCCANPCTPRGIRSNLSITLLLRRKPLGVCSENSATFRILIRQPQGVS
jgi:hypothetical protein